MQFNTLYRLGGFSMTAGGFVAAFAHIFHPAAPHDAQSVIVYLQATAVPHLILFFGILLILLGLPSLYLRVAAATGRAALAGFVLLFAGLILNDFIHSAVEFSAVAAMRGLEAEQAGELWMKTYFATPMAILQFAGAPVIVLGAIFFLVGTHKTAALPRFPRWFFAAFPLLMAAALIPGARCGRVVYSRFLSRFYRLRRRAGSRTKEKGCS